jgi:hypothetical protein
LTRVEIRFANSEQPVETGKEVDMRVMLRGVGVVIAVAIICIAGNSTWAEGGELSKADRSALCEIFSRIVRPVLINVSSKTTPHIAPARIQRCQTAEFRVVGPAASTVLITIYDSHIVFADDYQQDPNHDVDLAVLTHGNAPFQPVLVTIAGAPRISLNCPGFSFFPPAPVCKCTTNASC